MTSGQVSFLSVNVTRTDLVSLAFIFKRFSHISTSVRWLHIATVMMQFLGCYEPTIMPYHQRMSQSWCSHLLGYLLYEWGIVQDPWYWPEGHLTLFRVLLRDHRCTSLGCIFHLSRIKVVAIDNVGGASLAWTGVRHTIRYQRFDQYLKRSEQYNLFSRPLRMLSTIYAGGGWGGGGYQVLVPWLYVPFFNAQGNVQLLNWH